MDEFPSPNVQDQEVMVPSLSVEVSVKLVVKSEVLTLNAAVGGTLGAGAVVRRTLAQTGFLASRQVSLSRQYVAQVLGHHHLNVLKICWLTLANWLMSGRQQISGSIIFSRIYHPTAT